MINLHERSRGQERPQIAKEVPCECRCGRKEQAPDARSSLLSRSECDDRIWRGSEAYMVTLMYFGNEGTHGLVSRGLHLYSVLAGDASPHPFLNLCDLVLQYPFPCGDEPDGPFDAACQRL